MAQPAFVVSWTWRRQSSSRAVCAARRAPPPKERPDEELERYAREFEKKQRRQAERKAKREESPQRQPRGAQAPDRRRDASKPVGRGGTEAARESPAAPGASSSPGGASAARFRPDAIAGVAFLGSFTEDVPSSEAPEVAFIGRSNVGKSSTINCLAGSKKKVAKTSKQPGRTQQINFFRCVDKEERPILTLVDLPGYGYAKMNKQQQKHIEGFLERYLSSRDALKLVIVLIDARREPQEADIEIAEALRSLGLRVETVLTKIDLCSQTELRDNMEALEDALGLNGDDGGLIPFSAVTAQGRGFLWQVIREAVTE